jgi:ketosteroid isomerase-like protein
MASANADLVRRTYELWNTEGVEGLTEQMVAADVVFYDVPEVPDTGTFRGADAVTDRLREIIEVLGHFHLEVRWIEESGDYTLAAVELQGEAPLSGVPLSMPQFHISRWASGRLLEFRSYNDAGQARREYERLTANND